MNDMAPKQPGKVKPNMHRMFDGRNVATRPIPVIVDVSEMRAIAAAAGDQRPKGAAVNMPSGPRPRGATVVLGTPTASLAHLKASVSNPATGITQTEP